MQDNLKLWFQHCFLNTDKHFAVTSLNVVYLYTDFRPTWTAKQHACPCYAAQPWDNSALAHEPVKSIPELLSQTDHWLDLRL